VVFAWHPQGAFLATCGSNRIVNIFNRQGDPHAERPLEGEGKCLQLEWEHEGETLAILQSGSPVVKLWDANQGRESGLDTNQKDQTYVKWAVAAPMLAVGTQKGTLVLYDKRTLKRLSIIGKHSKRIVSGMWNSSNELALASENKQVTMSDIHGQTLAQHSLKGEPSDLCVRTTNDPSMPSQMLSAVVSGKSLIVLDASDPEQLKTMTDHSFPGGFGQIVSYDWFSERLVRERPRAIPQSPAPASRRGPPLLWAALAPAAGFATEHSGDGPRDGHRLSWRELRVPLPQRGTPHRRVARIPRNR